MRRGGLAGIGRALAWKALHTAHQESLATGSFLASQPTILRQAVA